MISDISSEKYRKSSPSERLSLHSLLSSDNIIYRVKTTAVMRSDCIIGKRIAFSAQVKVAFAYLEKYLYIPAFPINSDDFILIQIYICGNEAEIFLAFVAIADINYFAGMVSPYFTTSTITESRYLDLPRLFLFLL